MHHRPAPAALLPNRVAHAHACHAAHAHAHALCHAALCPLPCSLPLLIPLPSAPSAPAPAQRPGCPSPPPPGTGPLPHALGRGVLSATAQEPGSGVGLRIAPYLYARAGHHIKIRLYRFYCPGAPDLKSPPMPTGSPKIFISKNPAGAGPSCGRFKHFTAPCTCSLGCDRLRAVAAPWWP